MAYITPKENWTTDDAPKEGDLNRIEGNTHENHDAIVQEATARASADTAEYNSRVAAITSEANARSSADATLQANINSVSSGLSSEITTRSSADSALQVSINTEIQTRAAQTEALSNTILRTMIFSQQNDTTGYGYFYSNSTVQSSFQMPITGVTGSKFGYMYDVYDNVGNFIRHRSGIQTTGNYVNTNMDGGGYFVTMTYWRIGEP